MKSSILAIAILMLSAGAAAAQDGGKLTWTGKGHDPVKPAIDDALSVGRPMMFFFSVEGNKECIELCSGAFSHPDVIDAAAPFTCIFVECGNHRNNGLTTTLGITKFPTVVFADGEGTSLGQVTHRDGPSLAAAMRDITNRSNFLPRFSHDVDAAIAAGRKSGRPLIVYFFDDSPASVAINKSLSDAEIKPLRNKFEVAMVPMDRNSAVCMKYDVEHAPTILILNTRQSKPESKPLARITTSRSPRELRRDFDEALEASKAPVAETAPSASSVPLPPPKEQLSDDEIDRKFIQARMAVAADLAKRGMKAKAIDVLEDVIQSYPKHVLTKDVKAMLEQIKK
jgi:hypothetical protein